MRNYLYTLTFILLALCSCATRQGETATDGESIEMRYATLLSLHQGEGYISAEIRNPWDSTKVLHRYVLVPKASEMPQNLPKGDVIRTPLEHAVFFTSVHVSLINQLGAYGSIAGVCDSEYMYLDRLQGDIKAGRISDCGKGTAPNIEKIIDLSPDAVLLSPFENSGSYGKLGTIGIPIVECADYMETSALGRAEWMRFYGLLTGRQAEADSIFAGIEKRYNDLKASVANAAGGGKNPTVILDKRFGSTWYMAGANSPTGRMLADAGADYIFNSEKSSGAMPYDPEVVFDRGQQADLWLIKYNQDADLTYSQLAQEWTNYSKFEAFKHKNVYGCNMSKVQFYEETPFHPDLLLRDYIVIFHPEAIDDHTLRYFSKLEK